jgi:hypothetical protein
VTIPFPSLIKKSKMKGVFSFIPPTEVKVVGSFLLKTMIKANQCIDIAIEIPQVKQTKELSSLLHNYYF